MASRRSLFAMSEGGAQPNISKEKIQAFPYLLPPYNEQVRIVTRIQCLFNVIKQ